MLNESIILNEKEYVEEPLLKHLDKLGWQIIRAGEEGKYDPAITMRETFDEVFLKGELEKALLEINTWLEPNQLPDIIRELTAVPNTGLIEANQWVLGKLLNNTSADNKKTGQHSDTVKYVDFNDLNKESPGGRKNRYLAISQFKVKIPGTEKHIIFDIVLFVNGLPLVVIECKSSNIADPIGEAITQLLRYQNRRGEMKEGNQRFFWFNQFVVATSKQTAKYSTITGDYEHFVEWKDPYPFALSDIDQDTESISSQQLLTQGMLHPCNLLDIIQSFTIFMTSDSGKLIKFVPRYQQYRATRKIINNLLSGRTPLEKGGTIWHTQGSGKSLTMLFVVRKMYHIPELGGYKVVFITDRTNLEKQLKDTVKSVGFTLNVANRIEQLKGLLKTTTPDLVMGMIQKFQERDLTHEFPVLNTSEKILVLIDEAHRDQFKILGANLQKSLPKAVKIAFTGTPIEKMEFTFGQYIDKYTIKQSVDDNVTVEIIYEGRTHSGQIADPQAMNKRFEDVFPHVSDEERKNILGKYTWKGYLEAQETINDKARDILDHYFTHILPNGFKAQVVAVSREAAYRYKKAFDSLLTEKRATLKADDSNHDLLQKLKIETIFSGSENDSEHLKAFTDEKDHERIITSFKRPFDSKNDDGIDGDVGIIVVKSMLLTGFDAPIEQVMYLDNVIKNHNLLQAIARVNRVAKHKNCGFVVDYVGVARHLKQALEAYDDKDIGEILEVCKDSTTDIDNLQYSLSEVNEFVKKLGVENLQNCDAVIDELVDEETRNDFIALYRKVAKAIDRVLPKPEALKYMNELRLLSFISQSASNRYRDLKLSLKDVSRKIRELIEQYLVSHGVDPKIPPLPILSDEFKNHVKNKPSRAQADELRQGIQEYINSHCEEDPEFFERIAEKLKRLLKEYENQWDELAKELATLLEVLRKGREGEETYGFELKKELPFLGLLKKEIFNVKTLSELTQQDVESLINATRDIIERIRVDTQIVGFWGNITRQNQLRTFIASQLLTVFRARVMPKRKELSQKLLELAYHIYG